MSALAIENGIYRTPPTKIGWFARQFPSLTFHCKFLGIVYRASRAARRGQYDQQEWFASCSKILRALESVGVQIEVTGLEHLDRVERPCLVVGNHMSTLETVVLPVLLQQLEPLTFVVFSKLIEVPVFRDVMRSLSPVVVRQESAREDFKIMLQEGADRVERGMTLVVFPEGDRMPAFTPAKFNTIGVKLAARTSAPLVPVAIQSDAWPMGGPFSYLGRIYPERRVRIAFGTPMFVEGRGADAQAAIINFIEKQIAEWVE